MATANRKTPLPNLKQGRGRKSKKWKVLSSLLILVILYDTVFFPFLHPYFPNLPDLNLKEILAVIAATGVL